VRILIAVHQFFPDHTTGTEVLAFQVACELRKLGHEVRIVTGYPTKVAPPAEGRLDRYEYRGFQVARYYHQESAPIGEQSNIAEIEYSNLFFDTWFSSYLAEWRPDVVHFFHLKNLSSFSVDICHRERIPTVFTPTDFWLVCATTQLLLPNGAVCGGPDARSVNCLRHAVDKTQSAAVRWVFGCLPDAWVALAIRVSGLHVLAGRSPFSWALALARRKEALRERVSLLDCVLVPNRFIGEVLRAHGMSPKRLVHCRFGIDLSRFDVPAAKRDSLDHLRIGFIGSLSRPKGAHVLVEAVRRVPRDIALDVQVFGDPAVYPDYAKRLREQAKNDPRIRFCGTFPIENIAKVFEGIDVLVVPSVWYENTPLVMYSAQAAGCPIVASDLGSMAEIVRHRVDGLLFPSGDAAALAGAITELESDRSFLKCLAGQVRAPKSISKYTEELVTEYQNILKPD